MKWIQIVESKFAHRLQTDHQIVYLDEFPEKIYDKTIYIVGEIKHPWLLAFKCPCGCQNLIQLNLLKDADPCWRFKVDKKRKINIYPSVWRTNGCRSHFLVQSSKIRWIPSGKSY